MKKFLISALFSALILSSFASCMIPYSMQSGQSQNNTSQNTTQSNSTQSNNTNNAQSNIQNGNYIGEEQAKNVALTHAGLDANNVSVARIVLDYDNGRAKYEIEFWADNKGYDYEIDATTGDIIGYDYEMEQNYNANGQAVSITDVQAKQIVLDHAKFTEDQVVFAQVILDYDDGRAEYEIKFYANNVEYDYTIDANSGQIIDYEMESGR